MEENTIPTENTGALALVEVMAWYKPTHCIDALLKAINIFSNLGESDYTAFLSRQVKLYRSLETHVKLIDKPSFIDIASLPAATIEALEEVFTEDIPGDVTDTYINMISWLAEDAENYDAPGEQLKIIETFAKLIFVSRAVERAEFFTALSALKLEEMQKTKEG